MSDDKKLTAVAEALHEIMTSWAMTFMTDGESVALAETRKLEGGSIVLSRDLVRAAVSNVMTEYNELDDDSKKRYMSNAATILEAINAID